MSLEYVPLNTFSGRHLSGPRYLWALAVLEKLPGGKFRPTNPMQVGYREPEDANWFYLRKLHCSPCSRLSLPRYCSSEARERLRRELKKKILNSQPSRLTSCLSAAFKILMASSPPNRQAECSLEGLLFTVTRNGLPVIKYIFQEKADSGNRGEAITISPLAGPHLSSTDTRL